MNRISTEIRSKILPSIYTKIPFSNPIKEKIFTSLYGQYYRYLQQSISGFHEEILNKLKF